MIPSYNKLQKKNKQYIWHPFTQMKDYLESEPIIIERGEGITLIDVNGTRFYDGVSSIWLNVHGHCNSDINQAIIDQIKKISHSTLLGQANVPAVLLAEKIINVSPKNLTKVFYSDSGSEAVEIGLKIAYQYWKLKGQTKKKSFIAMTNAYHGDTIGATSVGGMDLFHATYRDLLFKTYRSPYPDIYRFEGTKDECRVDCIKKIEALINLRHEEIAGLIVEPVVQGAAGMIIMPDGFMKEIEAICKANNILLLADEVATGFGRTGKLFACEYDQVKPDIMMIAKGLTGGYLPLAATLTSEAVYSEFLGDYSGKKTFFHGHSYTGNQLGCAAAIANIDLFEKNKIIDSLAEKSSLMSRLLNELDVHPHVGDIRIKGMMAGIELVKDKDSKLSYPWENKMGTKVCDECRKLGMIIRPLGNVVIFMPPLVSANEELADMISILTRAIKTVCT